MGKRPERLNRRATLRIACDEPTTRSIRSIVADSYHRSTTQELAMDTLKDAKKNEDKVKDLSPKKNVKAGIIAVLKNQMQDFH
jgi:hypothetical protein